MTIPHEPLKFKINNPLSRIRHRKSATRGRTLTIKRLNNVYENLPGQLAQMAIFWKKNLLCLVCLVHLFGP